MTKEEALDNIYATENIIGDSFIDSEKKKLAMQMVTGCAKIVSMIDDYEVRKKTLDEVQEWLYKAMNEGLFETGNISLLTREMYNDILAHG